MEDLVPKVQWAIRDPLGLLEDVGLKVTMGNRVFLVSMAEMDYQENLGLTEFRAETGWTAYPD